MQKFLRLIDPFSSLRGGCIDSTNQSLMLLHLGLSKNDVSKLVVGPLSDYTVGFLRHFRDFFGVSFKLETFQGKEIDEEEDLQLGADKVLLTCVGANFKNVGYATK